MLPAKLNFAPDSTGFRYTVADCKGFPKIVWSNEPETRRLNDLLHGEAKPKRELCIEFLERALAHGEIEAEELRDRAQRAGFGRDVIYKALRSPQFIKSGGNQHAPAVYRLKDSAAIEVTEEWLQ
jgi:hypothetical protein